MKKLTGNGLWESSRMMLFEHRDALLNKKAERQHKAHPVLDEQHANMIAEQISEAYREQHPVQLRIYGEYEDSVISGIVTKVNPWELKVQIDGHWVPLADILEISLDM
ncbi:YolD-like family protein [Paenibacillus sp. JX-17]|uniref:YolD-like family protein n=1 Tax=Paenibacillus lacisoli TaxID=3064525 RepID=A0ABT9CB66_9BACL|nr:YolD-like family protein [Paenibacillus sp. JX-17]MDO7905232.1 YolD-like family protein [Paenibacillus sp. JX-17]